MLKSLRQTYAQAGVKACLLTFFQRGVEVYYASPALDTISTLGLSFQEGISALVEGGEGVFEEQQAAGVNGLLWLQRISLQHPGLSVERRTLLKTLSGERLHALVQDYNGNWWLFGQERGLRFTYRAGTDNFVSFTLSGLEKGPARKVLPQLIPSFLNFLN